MVKFYGFLVALCWSVVGEGGGKWLCRGSSWGVRVKVGDPLSKFLGEVCGTDPLVGQALGFLSVTEITRETTAETTKDIITQTTAGNYGSAPLYSGPREVMIHDKISPLNRGTLNQFVNFCFWSS